MDKLRNIKDYITGLSLAELEELQEFIEKEVATAQYYE